MFGNKHTTFPLNDYQYMNYKDNYTCNCTEFVHPIVDSSSILYRYILLPG